MTPGSFASGINPALLPPELRQMAKAGAGRAAEEALSASLSVLGIVHELEYAWGREVGRRWRADAAIPARRLLLEVDGRVHGVHEDKRVRDLERGNAAMALGWRVLRYTPEQVLDGTAAVLISNFLTTEEARASAPGGTV